MPARSVTDAAIDRPIPKRPPFGRRSRVIGFNMQSGAPTRSDLRFLLVRTTQVLITTLLTAVVGAVACSSNSRASDGNTVAADRDATSVDASERSSAQP